MYTRGVLCLRSYLSWLLKTVTEQKQTSIRWSLFSVLEDLEFANDIALPSHTWTHTQQKSSRLNDRARTIGLQIHVDKMKVMLSDPRRQLVIINKKDWTMWTSSHILEAF